MTASDPAPQGVTRARYTLLLSSVLLLGTLLTVSQAQITMDGSLGSAGPLTGPHYRIGAELGQMRGSNLFQSFGQFNVRRGESATFTGPPAIANILSRVTGGQPSSVDGLLRSEIAGANLYLLNPSGVLFGPNAALDVSGSFHVSTADFLRFADGAKFHANLAQESVLTVAPPAAFGFLGPTPAPIAIRGSSLRVPEGKVLSIASGDVQIVGGKLEAPSGRIQLASVASPGEVVFSPLGLAPDLQVDGFTRLGRVELSQDARLDVSRARGGTVLIRGGRLLVERSSILANTLGDVDGASLGVDLRIAGEVLITNGALIQVQARRGGNAGDVVVQVGTLTLMDGGRIDSSTLGAGQGGNVTVHAEGTVTIAGRREGERGGGQGQGQGQGRQASGIFSDTRGSGDAGRISVSAATLELNDGRISAFTFDRGNGGNIDLRVGRLTLTAGSQIGSRADDIGQGGHVTIEAREIVLDAGSEISASSQSERFRQFFSADPDVGKSGTITITVGETIRLENGSRITVETAQANAGDIVLRGGALLYLRNGGEITTSAAGGQGNGGNITIDAESVVLQGGQIRAEAFAGRGGNVRIATGVFLADSDSRVSASSTLGISGLVDIRAPVTSLVGTLAPLPQTFVSVAELLPARCAVRLSGGRASSLVVGGRDGLPSEPGDLLSSPLLEAEVAREPAERGEAQPHSSAFRFALLERAAQRLPRLQGGRLAGFSPAALGWSCAE
jgi:filamentous hemagglutinin family protein